MATECSDDPALQCHFKGHRDLVTALHFHPNGTQLVSSSLDQTLMLWNFRQHHRAYRWFILGDPFEIYRIDNGGYDADYCKGVYISKRWRVALKGIVPEKSRRLCPYWVHKGLFFCSVVEYYEEECDWISVYEIVRILKKTYSREEFICRAVITSIPYTNHQLMGSGASCLWETFYVKIFISSHSSGSLATQTLSMMSASHLVATLWPQHPGIALFVSGSQTSEVL